MATQPTNLSVPSESPRDLKFNAGKIDEFVTSLVNTYVDRFGNEHYTIEGLRMLAQQAIAQYGWVPVGTFQDGATLTLPNQILKDTTDGEYYRWDGSFLPSGKVVPNGSTPGSTGGVGVGAWLSVGDSTLRGMLAAPGGADWIDGGSLTRFKKRGSFAVGGTVQTRTDALIHSDGFYYINTGGTLPVTVAAGSSPDSAWLCVGLLGFYPTNYALNFGVSATGDMTDRVRKLHAYCNYSGEEAVYRGVVAFSVNSTAEIIISTNVDFCGARANFIKTQNLPDWTFIPAFRVYDPDFQSNVITGILQSELAQGATSIPSLASQIDTDGVICFDTQINFGKRYPTDSVFYTLTQVNKIIKGAQLVRRLDISMATGSIGVIRYRRSPANYVSIKNMVINKDGSNQLCAIRVERNRVNLDSLTIQGSNTDTSNIRTVIELIDCCDVSLSRVQGNGNSENANGSGSYLLGGQFVAELSLQSFGMEGWMPAIGMNTLNGVYVKDSCINRFDCHKFLHNLYVENVSLGAYGVLLGNGGGVISMKGVRSYKGYVSGRTNAVQLNTLSTLSFRFDYGNYFAGDIEIDDVHVYIDPRIDMSAANPQGPFTVPLVEFRSEGDYGMSSRIPNAYTISINNVVFHPSSYQYYIDFVGVAWAGRSITTGITFPFSIVVKNMNTEYKGTGRWGLYPVTMPDFATTFAIAPASEFDGNCRIQISNVNNYCNILRTNGFSFIDCYEPLANQTNANRLVPNVMVDNCTGVSIQYTIIGGICIVSNSTVTSVKNYAGSSYPAELYQLLNNCIYVFFDGAESSLGKSNITGGVIKRQSATSGNVSVADIKSSIGLYVNPGIVLSAGSSGVTATNLFTGIKL
jgi:hypothetical protein